MADPPNNAICQKLRETNNETLIDEIFDIMRSTSQENNFLLFQFINQDYRCNESKTIFQLLLSFNFFRQTNFLISLNNFSRDLLYFLLDINNSSYLQDNFYFINRCITHILDNFLLNNCIEQYCVISFQSFLMNFKDIKLLSINLSQPFDDNQFIQEFLPLFDEKFLIWCYFEEQHSQFCQLINQRKFPKPIDDQSHQIIQKRIQCTDKSHHNLFNEFLSKIFSDFNPNSNSITKINNSELFEEGIYEDFSRRIAQESGFENQVLPFRPVRHRFKISENAIQPYKSPSSVPPPKKKTIKLKPNPNLSPNLKRKTKDNFSPLRPRPSNQHSKYKNQDCKISTTSSTDETSEQFTRNRKNKSSNNKKSGYRDSSTSSVSESLSGTTSEDYAIGHQVSPASNPITLGKKPKVQLKSPNIFALQSDSNDVLLNRCPIMLLSPFKIERKKTGTLDIKKSDQSSDNSKNPK